MSNVIPMPDGYGGCLGQQFKMPGWRGSHVAYARGSDLVVEWYDFGDHAPYESANLLVFDRPAQQELMALLQEPGPLRPHELACRIAGRFKSFFEVRDCAQRHQIPFATETDFWP